MDVSEVLLFVGLGIISLVGRHIILYIAMFIGLLLWGLNVAQADLTTGIAIILVGCYFLYRGYDVWFGR